MIRGTKQELENQYISLCIKRMVYVWAVAVAFTSGGHTGFPDQRCLCSSAHRGASRRIIFWKGTRPGIS